MNLQEIIDELEQLKELGKVELNYESDRGRFFDVLDKDLAEKVLGYQISDDDFHNEIKAKCGGITNEIDCLQITGRGVISTPWIYLLDKNVLKECIEIFIYIYNNYDDFYGVYAYKQIDNFYNLCRQYNYMHQRLNGSVKRKKYSNNESGYIYVMKCMGTYKIGKSNNCERLGEYTNLPEEPEYYLVEYVDDMSKVESMLHKHFSSVRRREGQCEWFDLNEGHLLEIKELIEPHIIENYEHTNGYKKYVLKSA